MFQFWGEKALITNSSSRGKIKHTEEMKCTRGIKTLRMSANSIIATTSAQPFAVILSCWCYHTRVLSVRKASIIFWHLIGNEI